MKRTITDFFGQESKRKPTAHPETDDTPTEINAAAEQQATTSTALQPTRNDSESSSCDFGTMEWSKLSDIEKVRFLTEPWCLPKGFEWPYTERKDRGNIRRKYFGPQLFTEKFDVFSFSLSKGGIYCRPYAIFAPDEVRGVKLGRIVKTPLQKYTHLTAKNGHLTKHLSKQFHEDSLSRSNAFVALVKSNAGDV